MRETHPRTGCASGNLEHSRGVSLIDADLGHLQWRRVELLQERHRGEGAAGSVDDQVRRNLMRLSVVVFVQNGEGFAPIRRLRDIGDATSMPKLDIRFLREPPPADVLKQGPGEKEGVETKVALRERIEPRLFVSEGKAGPSLDSARFEKVGSDAGKQRFERPRASGKQGMRVFRLRRSGADIRPLRQRVAIEHCDFVERGRDGLRGGEAAHPSSDDNGMFGDHTRHRRLSDRFAGNAPLCAAGILAALSFSRWRTFETRL